MHRWLNVTDVGLKGAAEGLKKLDAMSEINLNFSRCPELTDDGFGAVATSFGFMLQLTQIYLDFYELAALR